METQLTDRSIMDRIVQILRTDLHIGVDDVKVEQRLAQDIGLDSMGILELLVALEHAFGIVIDDQDLEVDKVQNIGSLIEYVRSKTDR